MKKIILVVGMVLMYVMGTSQAISQRGTSAVTVQDARLFAQYNFRPPVFQDTVAANLNLGLDSCGALIFARSINGYYYRACSPKRWIKVSAQGSVGVDSAYISSATISNNAFILCRASGTCDTIILIDTLMPQPPSYQTMLVSGSAVWDTLLDYNITNCSYFILGNFYTSLATSVTLATADPSNPRIDVIYLDTSGNVGVITGIPSPNPIKPVVNPLSQIELTHININALGTSPSGLRKHIVYNENLQVPTEWNTPTSVFTANYDYLISPYIGFKSANSSTTYSLQFNNTFNVNADTCALLSMYLMQNGAVLTAIETAGTEAPVYYVQLLKAGIGVTNNIGIINGFYGYNRLTVGTYQNVVLPFSVFTFANSLDKTFDEILITNSAITISTVQFDYITIQVGGNAPPVVSNYWSLNGNDNSSFPTAKLGTTSNDQLSIVTNDVERINISNNGMITLNGLGSATDSSIYKPLVADATGFVTRMSSWVGGGGTFTSPNLQQVLDSGNVADKRILLVNPYDTSLANIEINPTNFNLSNESPFINLHIGNAGVYPLETFMKLSLGNDASTPKPYIYANDDGGSGQSFFKINSDTLSLRNTTNYGVTNLIMSGTNGNYHMPTTNLAQINDTLATLQDVRLGGGGGGISGSGTSNYLPMWNSTSSLTNSTIVDSASSINYYRSGYLRSYLNNLGSQYWYVNDGASETGWIGYGTPGGNPGIVMENAANLGRTDLRHMLNGGFSIAATTTGGIPSEQFYFHPTGNFTINQSADSNYRFLVNGDSKFTDSVKMSGLLSKTDTTVNKPLAIDANGNVVKMSNWVSGGGSGTVYVDSIYRTVGKDSIFYKKNGNTYAIKDSVGSGSGGGGSAVSYYLNGGTAASVATYYQMSNTAVVGTNADFSLAGNGLISQWLTDVGNPNQLQIAAGNWNFEMYMSASSNGGTPAFYVQLLKYDGFTFTSIASSSAVPENITGGTSIDLYLTSLAIPQTTLLATDRLAVRVYIVNSIGGRTITMHTQDSHLCQIITNFSSGISALNGLTSTTQTFATGTDSSDFKIVSTSTTHKFNLPTASATKRGALSSTDWSTFNGKIGAADTSVFQRKSISSYSIMANNTPSAANTTAQVFNDSSVKSYPSANITWTGGTAPTTLTTSTYTFTQVGKMVFLYIFLVYTNAASTPTSLTLQIPSDVPQPSNLGTTAAAGNYTFISGLTFGRATITTQATTFGNTSFMRRNAGNTAYEMVTFSTNGAFRVVSHSFNYKTD